jgi:hypothetical protein
VDNGDGISATIFQTGLVCFAIGSTIFIVIPALVLLLKKARSWRDVFSLSVPLILFIVLLLENERLVAVQFRPM